MEKKDNISSNKNKSFKLNTNKKSKERKKNPSINSENKKVSKQEYTNKRKYSFDDEYNELLKKRKNNKPEKIKYSFDDEYKEILKKKKKTKVEEKKYSFESENSFSYEKVSQEEDSIYIEEPIKDIKKRDDNILSRIARRRNNNQLYGIEKENIIEDSDDELINLFKKKEESKDNDEIDLEIKNTEKEELEDEKLPLEIEEIDDSPEKEIIEEREYTEEKENVEYHDINDFVDLVNKYDYKGKNKDSDSISSKEVKKVRKLKKWVYVILLIFIVGIGLLTYKIVNDKKEKTRLIEEQEMIARINDHYSEFVKTNSKTKLFKLENDDYVEIGNVYPDVLLHLDEQEINFDTKYFKIKNSDNYIAYEGVSKNQEIKNDERYKNYLPFNLNVVTKDSFTLFQDEKEMYTFNKSMEFPIIINNYENRYYVEYDNMLLNIKKDDVLKTIEKNNTDKKNQSTITTFCYHRVYDTNTKCTDPYICIKKESFDKEMQYLKDNNYLTLTLSELYMYLKGNLRVEKATVLTFDDGYNFQSADEVLDKYKLNGTMFVISGDFKEYSQFENLKAIDIQSHTHKMHKNYVCPLKSSSSQGGAILCASKKDIVADLKTSLEALKIKPIGIAYPFYDYNDNAIEAVKEAGFKMSFIGRAGKMGKSTPKETDVYKIPRMTVYDTSIMSFNTWKGYL